MSKGSAPRPLSVNKQAFDDAWSRTFGESVSKDGRTVVVRRWVNGQIIDRLLKAIENEDE